MRMIRGSLIAVVASSTLALSIGAQNQPTSIPMGLARALMGWPGESGAASISVGRAPNGVPAAYIPPAPVSILGGMASGQGRTVVFVYPGAVPDPTASYMTFLQGAGWKQPPVQPVRGGFVRQEELTQRNAWLCRDSERATVLPASGAPTGSSWVRVTFYQDENGSRCDEPQPSGFRDDEITFPTLLPPPGAHMLGGSSGGGGFDSREVSSRMRTTLALTDLLTHYTLQLQKAGWTLGERVVGTGVAFQAVETRDSHGRTWHGALSVIVSGTLHDLELRMTKAGT